MAGDGGGGGGGGGGDGFLGGIYTEVRADIGGVDRDLARVRDELRRTEEKLRALEDAFGRGDLDAAKYAKTVQGLKDRMEALRGETAAAVAGADALAYGSSRLDASMGRAGHGARNMNMAILEGSRALEDMQYGVAGVINNVPGLIMSLGGGMGLAGVISVATVGAYQLYHHWDDLMGVFGRGKTLTEAEEMERLAKATSRTAEETAKLVEYRKKQQALEEIRGTHSEGQKADASAFGRGLETAGGPATERAILGAMVDEEKARGIVQHFTEAGQREMYEAQKRQAADLLVRLKAGDAAAHDRLAELMGRSAKLADSDFGRAYRDVERIRKAQEDEHHAQVEAMAKETERRREEALKHQQEIGPGAKEFEATKDANRRAAEAAKQKREQQVAEAAQTFGGAYQGAVAGAMDRRQRRGIGPDSDEGLARQLDALMDRQGVAVAVEIRAEVARRIVAAARKKFEAARAAAALGVGDGLARVAGPAGAGGPGRVAAGLAQIGRPRPPTAAQVAAARKAALDALNRENAARGRGPFRGSGAQAARILARRRARATDRRKRGLVGPPAALAGGGPPPKALRNPKPAPPLPKLEAADRARAARRLEDRDARSQEAAANRAAVLARRKGVEADMDAATAGLAPEFGADDPERQQRADRRRLLRSLPEMTPGQIAERMEALKNSPFGAASAQEAQKAQETLDRIKDHLSTLVQQGQDAETRADTPAPAVAAGPP